MRSQHLLGAACVAAYFGWFVSPALRTGFTVDDLMNCHRALVQPLGSLLADHVLVYRFSPEYRPLGSLFYRAVYRAFGFHPLPFHAVLLGVLAANAVLAAAVVRRMTGSAAAGFVAALVHCYHGQARHLYSSAGFCFDVFCFFFYALAFVIYASGRRWLALVPYVLCLDAKEIGVSWPLLCLAHETAGAWPRLPAPRRLLPLAAAAGITIAFIAGRVQAPDALASMEPYRPDIRWQTFLARTGYLLADVGYRTPAAVRYAALATLAIAAYALWSKRAAGFQLLVLTVAGVLPIAFIPQRELSAASIPFLGVAGLVGIAWTGIARRVRAPGVVVVPAAALALAAFHHRTGHYDPTAYLADPDEVNVVVGQMRSVCPRLPRGAHVLFVRDPFPDYRWNSLFLARLVCDDMTMEVDRADFPAPGCSQYDAVLHWQDGVLRGAHPPPECAPARSWLPGAVAAVSAGR